MRTPLFDEDCLRQQRLMAFFDEAGTHRNSPIVGFGGLFAYPGVWMDFQQRWTQELQAPLKGTKPALRRFHMTECMARTGEFKDYTLGEQDGVIHDFRQIILDRNIWGYSIMLSRQAWDLHVSARMQSRHGNAEQFCFQNAVYAILKYVHERLTNPNVTFIFDKRHENAELSEFIRRQLATFPPYPGVATRTKICAMGHGVSAELAPLQAADMFAWENCNVAQTSLKAGENITPSPHLSSFFTGKRFASYWWNEDAIQSFVAEHTRFRYFSITAVPGAHPPS